jgi:hypothetical protein
MKINELLNRFEIFTTNEEQKLLDKLDGVSPIEYYTERERFVIENLIKKSLVSKVKHNNSYMVKKND